MKGTREEIYKTRYGPSFLAAEVEDEDRGNGEQRRERKKQGNKKSAED